MTMPRDPAPVTFAHEMRRLATDEGLGPVAAAHLGALTLAQLAPKLEPLLFAWANYERNAQHYNQSPRTELVRDEALLEFRVATKDLIAQLTARHKELSEALADGYDALPDPDFSPKGV